MGSIDGGDMDNIICATEPNDGHDLETFELPDDSDELLTVDLSPKAGRMKSKSFRLERHAANATAPAKQPTTTTGRSSNVGLAARNGA